MYHPVSELPSTLVEVTAHRFDHARRNQARKNLRDVLGDEIPAKQRKAIVLELYRNMGRLAIEYALLLSGRNLRPLAQWFVEVDDRSGREALEKHDAVVFVTCHGGNFELLGGWCSESLVKLHPVAKDLRNPYLSRRIMKMRTELGMEVISKFPALRSILRHLRSGDSVALLSDQRRRNRGLIVDFFGRPAATVDTPAVLALRFGLPIVPGYSYRVGDGMHYGIEFHAPIYPDPSAPRDAEVVRLTQAVNDSIERFVRAHPEQWNWTQPRWKISGKVASRARQRGESK